MQKDTELVVIHIPLDLYSSFVQPLLQLLVPAKSSAAAATEDSSTGLDGSRTRRPWAYEHPFVNVSITSIECSVACSRSLAKQLFQPVIDALSNSQRSQVTISRDDYVAVQVDGEGSDAGQRVVELTAPLAMNGM